MKKLVLIAAFAALTAPTLAQGTHKHLATCTGSATCRACKNCKYCKHCSKQGGTCGVCSTKPTAPGKPGEKRPGRAR